MFEESFGDIWADFIGNGVKLQGEVSNGLGTTLYSCIKTFGKHQFFVGRDKKCTEFFLEIDKIVIDSAASGEACFVMNQRYARPLRNIDAMSVLSASATLLM